MNSRLAKLRDMRGGWKAGHRNAAVFYVSMTLHALRADEKEVRRVLAQHLEGMAQPAGDRLTIENALRTYRSCAKPHTGGPNHQTVSDALDVTVEEAGILSADRRHTFPPASRLALAISSASPAAAAAAAHAAAAASAAASPESSTPSRRRPTSASGPGVRLRASAACRKACGRASEAISRNQSQSVAISGTKRRSVKTGERVALRGIQSQSVALNGTR
jgi:hypothetical protein